MFFLLLFLPTLEMSAQTDPSTVQALQADYLKQSKRQKTVGLIMLGGGAMMTTVGLSVAASNFEWNLFTESETEPGYGLGVAMFYTGLVSMIGSIPILVSATKNKTKAMELRAGLKMESRYQIQKGSILNAKYPALGFQIRF